MTVPEDFYTNVDKLIELHEKQNDLMRQLKRAMRMADLVGIPPKEIKGPLVHKVREGPSAFRPWAGAIYSIRIGDGPWEDFLLTNVHRDLWPDHLREPFDRWERSRDRRIKEGRR